MLKIQLNAAIAFYMHNNLLPWTYRYKRLTSDALKEQIINHFTC